MNEDKGYEYPYAHPKGKEINELKRDIDIEFKKIIELREISRDAYKKSMESLKMMGDSNNVIFDKLHAIGEKMVELQAIIESPLI